MNNKLNGFTVPNKMSPTVEKINRENIPAEQSALSGVEGLKGVEGGGNTLRVETETVDESNRSKQDISPELNPQSYSAENHIDETAAPMLKEDYNEFKQLLDIKNGEDSFSCGYN